MTDRQRAALARLQDTLTEFAETMRETVEAVKRAAEQIRAAVPVLALYAYEDAGEPFGPVNVHGERVAFLWAHYGQETTRN